VAQARSTLANFRAQLVTARATLLQREAALRNILGIPPSDGREIVPVSPPNADWIETEWSAVLQLAAQYRPDLIQQKLTLEQDEQNLLLARNQSLPKVDAAGRYRWSHLEGRAADGRLVAADPGQFTGWQLGVEVSLPLALADARAKLRQQELTVMRDRANLNQALHQASHELSSSYQSLAQFFEEYKAYQQTRKASRTNLDVQAARYSNGLTIYLDVLQAISAWGNAVDSEAQALLRYNTELANLERHTGTILESHGIYFNEEGFPSVGRLGRLFPDHCYPAEVRPGPNRDRYPAGASPSENAFQLGDLDVPRRRTPESPRRRIDSPPAPHDEPRQPTAEDLRRLFLPPNESQPLPRPRAPSPNEG
jgi:outer membrane protein TolC